MHICLYFRLALDSTDFFQTVFLYYNVDVILLMRLSLAIKACGDVAMPPPPVRASNLLGQVPEASQDKEEFLRQLQGRSDVSLTTPTTDMDISMPSGSL